MKFFLRLMHLLMIVILFLTLFVSNAHGELHVRKQSGSSNDFVTQGIYVGDKPPLKSQELTSQRPKQFAHTEKKIKSASRPDILFCCNQTKSGIEGKISELKQTIKTLRACKLHKRDIAGSFWQQCSRHTEDKPTIESTLGSTDLDLKDMSNKSKSKQREPIERDDKDLFKVEVYEDSSNDGMNVSRFLPDKCLRAVDQYLNHFEKGTGEVKKALGEYNLKRMKEITPPKKPEKAGLKEISHTLIKCQYDALKSEEYENVNMLHEIIEIVLSNYNSTAEIFSVYKQSHKKTRRKKGSTIYN